MRCQEEGDEWQDVRNVPRRQGIETGRGPLGPVRAARVVRRKTKLRCAFEGKPCANQADVKIRGWRRMLEWIARRVYPKSNATCSPGQYYDPNAEACVFVCQEGYYYDQETRSCRKVLEVQKDLRPAEQYATRTDAGVGFGLRRKLAKAVAEALLGRRKGGQTKDQCAVGFYFDPVTKACVPLCGHGYVYDRIRKECVPKDGSGRNRR